MRTQIKIIFIIVMLTVFNMQADLRAETSLLSQTFNLTGDRSLETQYYVVVSQLSNFNLDGTLESTNVYKLHLECTPQILNGSRKNRYTCHQYSLKVGDSPEVSIPALKSWSYIYKVWPNGKDEKGQVLGIDHRAPLKTQSLSVFS